MRLCSDAGDCVEIECTEPHDAPGDLRLLVRVKRHHFCGEVDAWVEQRAWFGFTQDLTILEQERQGAARLEGMSPGELSLSLRSLDGAGSVGVEGAIGYRSFDGEVELRFSVFAFDPSQLVAFAREARALSKAAG